MKQWVGEHLGSWHNEVMIRWVITLYADVGVMLTSQLEAERMAGWWKQTIDIDEIRGVPVEERFVYISDRDEASEYVANVFKRYVDLNPRTL